MVSASNQILLDLYGCAEDPQRWGQVLDGICREFKVRSAVAQVFQRDGFKLHQRWTVRDTFSSLHAERHDALVNNDQNPRTDLRVVSRPRNDMIYRDEDIFAENCPHFARLRSRLSAIGLGNSVAATFSLGKNLSFALVLHRASDDRRPFMSDDQSSLRELVPHLQQLMKLSAGWNESSLRLATFQEAINGLHTGVLVCDAGRRINWLNEAAEQILRRSLYLNTGNGILRCASSADDAKLGELIADLPRGKQPRARAAIAFGTETDAVQIAAFPAVDRDERFNPWFEVRERFVLLLSDLGRPPSFSVREVGQLFNLSPAEAALAAALCAGWSVSDFARDRGISVGTARIQLKSVLSKTNTRRQADLVRQICASIAAQASAAAH